MIDNDDKAIYHSLMIDKYITDMPDHIKQDRLCLAMTFISKMHLTGVYSKFITEMVKELKDSDIRIAMIAEREE